MSLIEYSKRPSDRKEAAFHECQNQNLGISYERTDLYGSICRPRHLLSSPSDLHVFTGSDCTGLLRVPVPLYRRDLHHVPDAWRKSGGNCHHGRSGLYFLHPVPAAQRIRSCHVSSHGTGAGCSVSTDLRDAVSGKSFLFRRQPVHFSYAGERHQNSSCQSRKGCPLRQPFSYGVYFSLPILTKTAPIIIKKSARLNTRSFSRFHGV